MTAWKAWWNMTGFPRLFRQFILRALVGQRMRTGLAILGITLGVAVMLAIRLANQSITGAFRTAVEAVAGDTSLEITGVTGRFDELLLRELGWLRRLGTVSPVRVVREPITVGWTSVNRVSRSEAG